MKRANPWSDGDDESSDDDESSSPSHSCGGSDPRAGERVEGEFSKRKVAGGKFGRGKKNGMSFEALKQHGFKGGLSVLGVPLPKEEQKHDWSWSNGQEGRNTEETEESYEERQRTRAALASGEELVGIQTLKERRNVSFSHKEKKKRELGQASRGKNYVEEEKRLLRESGIYSGFDT